MTQDELGAALALAQKIRRLQDSLDDLRAGGVRAAGTTAPVQGGPSTQPGQQAAELEQEIAALAREKEVEGEIIRRYIVRVGLPERVERIMILRYAEGMPWRAVGVATGYSYPRLMQLHRDHIQKIIHDYT